MDGGCLGKSQRRGLSCRCVRTACPAPCSPTSFSRRSSVQWRSMPSTNSARTILARWSSHFALVAAQVNAFHGDLSKSRRSDENKELFYGQGLSSQAGHCGQAEIVQPAIATVAGPKTSCGDRRPRNPRTSPQPPIGHAMNGEAPLAEYHQTWPQGFGQQSASLQGPTAETEDGRCPK